MFVFKQIVGNKRLARHNNIHAAYSLGKHAYLGTLKCFLSQHIATFVLKHLAAEPISRAHDRHLRLGTMGATSKRGGTRTQQCMLCANRRSLAPPKKAALRKTVTSHFDSPRTQWRIGGRGRGRGGAMRPLPLPFPGMGAGRPPGMGGPERPGMGPRRAEAGPGRGSAPNPFPLGGSPPNPFPLGGGRPPNPLPFGRPTNPLPFSGPPNPLPGGPGRPGIIGAFLANGL